VAERRLGVPTGTVANACCTEILGLTRTVLTCVVTNSTVFVTKVDPPCVTVIATVSSTTSCTKVPIVAVAEIA
jgi:hypothetical protein